MKIYQHVDEFNDRDGIGNDISGFDPIFKSISIPSAIVCRINNSKKKLDILSTNTNAKFNKNDIHILHYGGAGYPIDFFSSLPGKKILRFHNITPIYFFKNFIIEDIYKSLETNQTLSFFELYSLKRVLDCVWSDSLFNQEEYLNIIGDHGNIKLDVLPVTHHYPLVKEANPSGFKIGFVGRIVPNKKIEDLLLTLFYLKKINPNYTLTIFGKKNSIFQTYFDTIEQISRDLELSESIEIIEDLDDLSLQREFAKLNIYLSMSEHEGFGIPILEAMALQIPVVAFSSSAVNETVLNAGVLFSHKNFPLVAELIHKINSDSNIKKIILGAQNKKIKQMNDFPYKEKILAIAKR